MLSAAAELAADAPVEVAALWLPLIFAGADVVANVAFDADADVAADAAA